MGHACRDLFLTCNMSRSFSLQLFQGTGQCSVCLVFKRRHHSKTWKAKHIKRARIITLYVHFLNCRLQFCGSPFLPMPAVNSRPSFHVKLLAYRDGHAHERTWFIAYPSSVFKIRTFKNQDTGIACWNPSRDTYVHKEFFYAVWHYFQPIMCPRVGLFLNQNRPDKIRVRQLKTMWHFLLSDVFVTFKVKNLFLWRLYYDGVPPGCSAT
jgi:hypothetical protein